MSKSGGERTLVRGGLVWGLAWGEGREGGGGWGGETNLRVVDAVAGGDVEGRVGAEGSGEGGEGGGSEEGAEGSGAEDGHSWCCCCCGSEVWVWAL